MSPHRVIGWRGSCRAVGGEGGGEQGALLHLLGALSIPLQLWPPQMPHPTGHRLGRPRPEQAASWDPSSPPWQAPVPAPGHPGGARAWHLAPGSRDVSAPAPGAGFSEAFAHVRLRPAVVSVPGTSPLGNLSEASRERASLGGACEGPHCGLLLCRRWTFLLPLGRGHTAYCLREEGRWASCSPLSSFHLKGVRWLGGPGPSSTLGMWIRDPEAPNLRVPSRLQT